MTDANQRLAATMAEHARFVGEYRSVVAATSTQLIVAATAIIDAVIINRQEIDIVGSGLSFPDIPWRSVMQYRARIENDPALTQGIANKLFDLIRLATDPIFDCIDDIKHTQIEPIQKQAAILWLARIASCTHTGLSETLTPRFVNSQAQKRDE